MEMKDLAPSLPEDSTSKQELKIQGFSDYSEISLTVQFLNILLKKNADIKKYKNNHTKKPIRT